MRAAILCGGKGTRIGELFPDIPKSMIPVMGKPLLHYQLDLLVSQGINDITLMAGYKADIIREHFGNGSEFGANIKYIIEDEPLGTGGALSLLPKEDTLILMGDVYLDVDLKKLISFHREKKAKITLFAHPNSHPHDSDIVVKNEDFMVTQWRSKKEESRGDCRNLVNAGLYLFDKDIIPIGNPIKRDIDKDLIAPQIQKGSVFAYQSTEYIKDMGTPERLAAVTRDIKNGIASAKNLKNIQKAVFLDRDGTINIEDGFLTQPEQLRLIPGVAQAIKRLNQSPYLVICVTNQPVIARGDVSFEGLEKIHARMDTMLGREGAYLDDIFFCPHHPDKGFEGEVAALKIKCDCRKPEPGMLLRASERYNINLGQSYMVGDRTSDIMAGKAAGCKTIGLKTGSGLKDGKYQVDSDIVCDDLVQAVYEIINAEE